MEVKRLSTTVQLESVEGDVRVSCLPFGSLKEIKSIVVDALEKNAQAVVEWFKKHANDSEDAEADADTVTLVGRVVAESMDLLTVIISGSLECTEDEADRLPPGDVAVVLAAAVEVNDLHKVIGAVKNAAGLVLETVASLATENGNEARKSVGMTGRSTR